MLPEFESLLSEDLGTMMKRAAARPVGDGIKILFDTSTEAKIGSIKVSQALENALSHIVANAAEAKASGSEGLYPS